VPDGGVPDLPPAVEQAQAQVDGGRVQCIDRRIEIQFRRFLGVKIAGSQDQAHGHRVINAPVPLVQCVRERGSSRYAAQAHVKQLALVGGQTRFDVAQPCAGATVAAKLKINLWFACPLM